MMDTMLADAMLDTPTVMLSCRPATRIRRAHFSPRITKSPDGSYAFALQAPGVAPSDLTIEVHELSEGAPRIVLRGATKSNAGLVRRLDYSLALPQDANLDKVTAQAADGLITVRMPKTADAGVMHIAPSATPVDDKVEHYKLTILAPGIASNDLDISVERGVLKVRGQSKRTGATLDRAYKLPRNADLASAHATHLDGLLTITAAKKNPAAARRIPVNEPQAVSAAESTEQDVAGHCETTCAEGCGNSAGVPTTTSECCASAAEQSTTADVASTEAPNKTIESGAHEPPAEVQHNTDTADGKAEEATETANAPANDEEAVMV